MLFLLEGVFRKMDDGQLWAATARPETLTVQAALTTLVGHHVQLALHHLPAFPFDPTLRGLGCCHVDGPCPQGHDAGQTDLYNLAVSGVLLQDPWRVECFDGTVHPIDLDKLDGHLGRVAVSSISELEKLRDAMSDLSNQVRGFSVGYKVTGEV